MATTYWLWEPLTGLLLDTFEPLEGPWSTGVNEAEEISVTIDLNSPREKARDWKNTVSPWKTGIAVDIDGRWYGGPILPKSWKEDDHRLKVTAKGFWTYLDHRVVLPPSAATLPFIGGDLKPNPALNTVLRNYDLGTIAKKIVQQALAWPGAGYPVTFESDRGGVHGREYLAVNFKSVGDALRDLSEVLNGPEMRFRLYQVDDNHLGWQFITGTEAQPRLQSDTVHLWDASALRPSATGVEENSDPTRMADGSFSVGGKSDDTVIVGRAMSTVLRDAGFPYLEVVDTSHSNVKEVSTANSYAAEGLRVGSKEALFTAFQARADASPFLPEYNPGDLCEIVIEGSAYLPKESITRRIARVAGDELGQFITITMGETFG